VDDGTLGDGTGGVDCSARPSTSQPWGAATWSQSQPVRCAGGCADEPAAEVLRRRSGPAAWRSGGAGGQAAELLLVDDELVDDVEDSLAGFDEVESPEAFAGSFAEDPLPEAAAELDRESVR
jgi:hypothetical protein